WYFVEEYDDGIMRIGCQDNGSDRPHSTLEGLSVDAARAIASALAKVSDSIEQREAPNAQ
ncbi:MAG: hypothetical protein AAGH89_18720, partial [Verrucomicrobiota bacterium]